MIKLLTCVFAANIALCSTAAIANEVSQAAIRMVILGTKDDAGHFSARAVSMSVGVGTFATGGHVANAEAIGTAVIAGGNLVAVAGGLVGFESFSSPYETCLVAVGTCH